MRYDLTNFMLNFYIVAIVIYIYIENSLFKEEINYDLLYEVNNFCRFLFLY